MKQYKNIDVVMLPTNNNPKIWLYSDSKTIALHPHNEKFDGKAIGQHLYFLSNEPIKQRDWCFEKYNGESLAPKNHPKFTDNEGNIWWLRNDINCIIPNKQCCKKIIATTDSSLNNKSYEIGDTFYYEGKRIITEKDIKGEFITYKATLLSTLKNKYPNSKGFPASQCSVFIKKNITRKNPLLPKPSQEWIKYFIEQYNQGNIITKVKVEYKNYHEEFMNPVGKTIIDTNKLVINPDNIINIKFLVKDGWDKIIEKYNEYSNNNSNILSPQLWLKENYNPPTLKT